MGVRAAALRLPPLLLLAAHALPAPQDPPEPDPRVVQDAPAAVALEDEITVTAGHGERRIQDVPTRVEVVDREEIEEKALMTPGSVAMLLAETTGLRVQTTAPSTAAANVRIQGLRGRYTLLLADGLPTYGVGGGSLSVLQVRRSTSGRSRSSRARRRPSTARRPSAAS